MSEPSAHGAALASPTYKTRPPLQPIQTPSAFRLPQMIKFRHPGYPSRDHDAPILTLPAFDGDGQGLHHGTALTACAIIADNAFDGYLTETRDSEERILLDYDDLLTQSEYWFHVPRPTSHGPEPATALDGHFCYPIVPSFSYWTFPHYLFDQAAPQPDSRFRTHLRQRWRYSAIPATDQPSDGEIEQISVTAGSATVHARDGEQCRISGQHHFCEVAHVVPKSEEAWWSLNGMDDLLPNRTACFGIRHTSNSLLLRVDLHRAFDAPCFALLPKGVPVEGTTTTAAAMTATFVPHFISPFHGELASQLHDRQIRDISAVLPALLFARFAWTVIPSVGAFLRKGIPRQLVFLDPLTRLPKNALLQSLDCRALAMALKSKSRSASPKKRSRSELDWPMENRGATRDQADEHMAKRLRLNRFSRDSDRRNIVLEAEPCSSDGTEESPQDEWTGHHVLYHRRGLDGTRDEATSKESKRGRQLDRWNRWSSDGSGIGCRSEL